MFGENNGTVFLDYSPNPKSVTVAGDAKTSTTQSKYYGSSGYFDGTGDYISVAASSDFELGTDDFAISAWIYKTGVSAVNFDVVSYGTAGVSGLFLNLDGSNNLVFGVVDASTIMTSSTTLNIDTWYHAAVTRSAGVYRLFLDGIVEDTTTRADDLNASGSVFRIATNRALSTYANGYIQDISIIKGTAVWTANFTPPTRLIEQSPDVTGYLAVSGGINPYSITLSLTESLAATDFTAVVTNANTGFIMSKTTVSGATPTINLSTNDPCFVTLYPDYGTQWTASTAYDLNDKVFPTDPTTSPYYYECTTAGTSDASEPTWPTSGTVNDGTAVWTYVEQMVQPITHGPLIPS